MPRTIASALLAAALLALPTAAQAKHAGVTIRSVSAPTHATAGLSSKLRATSRTSS